MIAINFLIQLGHCYVKVKVYYELGYCYVALVKATENKSPS